MNTKTACPRWNPYQIFVWTTKEMQAWVDQCGSWGQWDGKAKAEAAERARVETEQRIAREQEQSRIAAERKAAQEKADAEAKEAARLKAEAEKPYREKILAIAQAVELIDIPRGIASERVKLLLTQCSTKIRTIANGPLE